MSRITAMRAQLSALSPLSVEITDESHLHAGHAGAFAGGGHYLLHIVSSEFTGKSTIARHRMIYSALGEMMKHEIHALNIQANTPEEI
ncbi:MAG: BolA family transcriptional regulator [Gallionella sp.]|nr:BolA family transcriptional regulator [Gallionella sp.]